MLRILIFLTLLSGWLEHSLPQEKVINKTFSLAEASEINLNLKFANTILIKGWEKKEARLTARISIDEGRKNDWLVHDFKHQENRLSIVSGYKKPEGADDQYHQNMHITYELMVPQDALLSVESINGNIEILGLQQDIRAKSISGFVDVTWNPALGADMALKSISGDIYSDLDIQYYDKSRANNPVNFEIKGQFKDGKYTVNLASISGNVYLRKQK
ncbi:hypothetical protein AAG747_02810 [Rapidithrix thailandica]|uniref:Adhesin domain-containing protein n=1 Tax=Rapidithrix thailandica TaxID=413964 RepID=A0AAW9S360_9BACT